MKHWVSRLGLVALCTAIALPAGAVMEPFTFDPEMQPETIGTQRDPGEHQAAMAALQKGLSARQVARGLRSEAVVPVSAAERKTIDVPTATGGKYQVGVNKALGTTVSFAGAGSLGGRTRDLALGSMRGDGNGGFTWTAAVRSPGATALRLHLTGVDLPPGRRPLRLQPRGPGVRSLHRPRPARRRRGASPTRSSASSCCCSSRRRRTPRVLRG